MRYPSKYTHFVVDSQGVIHSAWENASDAKDAARAPADWGPALPEGITCRVYTRRRLERMGYKEVC